VLDVEGSLFFAGARTLFDALPAIADAKRPVVILRLRGYTRVGATLIDVLDEYADQLAEAGGRLYLSGVDEKVGKQLRRSGKLDVGNVVHLVPVEAVLGASTRQALEHASGFWKSSPKI
jgi:SulP family sulfate permease